jgi:hypothetical protein
MEKYLQPFLKAAVKLNRKQNLLISTLGSNFKDKRPLRIN